MRRFTKSLHQYTLPVQYSPIVWITQFQNRVKTSTFGREFETQVPKVRPVQVFYENHNPCEECKYP